MTHVARGTATITYTYFADGETEEDAKAHAQHLQQEVADAFATSGYTNYTIVFETDG